MKKRYKHVAVTAMVLGMSLALAGCGNQKKISVAENNSVAVDVMEVTKGTLSLSNQFVGNVAPQESVYIIPMAQGKVTATYFEVGDIVKAGDVLFEVDDEAARLQLKQAELTYKNTKAQVDSSWNSAEDQQQSAIEQLELQKTSALAQLQAAQTQYYTLKDSVEQGNDALNSMSEQHGKIDTMSTQEVLDLAESMAEMMVSSSSGIGGGVDITKLLEGLFGNSGEGDSMGDMSQEDKDAMADALRPELKTMISEQMAELEKSMWQAQMSLNTAQTSMQAAQASYDMMNNSIEEAKNTSLEDTKKQLDNSLNLAALAVDSAKLALSYYDVASPIGGTVISKGVAVNGFATSSSPAYVIANNDTMMVTFHVSESVKNTLMNGADFKVERNGVIFDGVITEIGNAVNQQTGLFQVKGMVYANGAELPSGVSVKVTVETYRAEDAFIIPYDAVYYENSGAYVYVMKEETAVKTPVSTGIFDDENIEITDGLYLEDKVITSWSPRLIHGASVQVADLTKTAE